MKSKKELNSFIKYCKKYPDLRFWQALYSWAHDRWGKRVRIKLGDEDPYYWNNKETIKSYIRRKGQEE